VNASKQRGGNSSVDPVGIKFSDGRMTVELSDGRTLGVPLDWFPKLRNATAKQLEGYLLSPCGLHWEELDEDISIAGLLAGRSDQTRRLRSAAE
jgi:hypothetical protein